MHKTTDIFRLFNPNKLSDAHAFRRELAIRVSEALSEETAAILALQLQGLMRALYYIEETDGGNGMLLVSDGTAWRRRLATLRRLEEMRRAGNSSAPRLDAAIVQLVDSGRLTFKITSVLSRKDYDLERACVTQIARSADYKSWGGPITADALHLISKVRAASINEARGIHFVFERFHDWEYRSASTFVSALAEVWAQVRPGSGTSHAGGTFADMVAKVVALPKFVGALDELKLELWSRGHIASIADFERQVLDNSNANDGLVGTLATAMTLARFCSLSGAVAEELVDMGLIESTDEFLDKIQERENTHRDLIEAVAAAATLPCYRDSRDAVAKELQAKGRLESGDEFEAASGEFEYWIMNLNRGPRATYAAAGGSNIAALRLEDSAPPAAYLPSGTFPVAAAKKSDRPARSHKHRGV